MFTSVRVLRLSNANLTNQGLNKIFTDLCENLLKVRNHHGAGFTLALFFGVFFLSWTCCGCLCLVLGFTSLQFIMFVSEFLLQAALYDPLLSLSSQLHRSSARRRAHTGETIQAITHLSSCQSSECNWEKKILSTAVPLLVSLRRSQWQPLPWPMTRNRLRRRQLRSPSTKVSLSVNFTSVKALLRWRKAFTSSLIHSVLISQGKKNSSCIYEVSHYLTPNNAITQLR